MAIEWSNRVVKAQVAALCLICFSILLMLIGVLTPAWQVAEDVDANQYVQSGLWVYCPGLGQCWYIFNDDSVNFYEKAQVCRFFLFGDCRKKLVRTPYFFSWHKAVFIVMLFALAFAIASAAVLAISILKRRFARMASVIYIILALLSFLLLAIGLAVFVTNAEMLESRFLIGVKQTFRKEYGYSFYLTATAVLFMLFSLLAGVLLITYLFFTRDNPERTVLPGMDDDELEWKRRHLMQVMQEPESQFDPVGSNYSFPVLEQQVFDHPPRPGSMMGSQPITPLPQPESMHSPRAFASTSYYHQGTL